MGSLIQASLTQGHKALLFYTPNALEGAKAYQNVTREKLKPLERLGADLVPIKMDELPRLGLEFGIDVLCMQEGFYNLKARLGDLKSLQESGTGLVSLSHFFEIAQQPIEALEHFDKTLYISDYARNLHFELQQAHNGTSAEKKKLMNRLSITGSPMFDQIGKISRDEARKDLGLPPDRKVVLLIDPVIAPTTPWRFHVWRDASKLTRTRDAIRAGNVTWLLEIWFGSTFREIASEIKKFCKRQEAILIVKSRGKQADSPFLSKAADLYIDGFKDEYFPIFSTYMLLAAADLCITANSMAAVEAVAAGVPCLNIYLPHHDRAAGSTPGRIKYEDALLNGASESLMNYPGCILKLDRRKASHWFAQHKIEDVNLDPQRQKEYVRKYLGIEETSASQRILTELGA